MNSSHNRASQKYIHQSELLWAPERRADSPLKCCCFCIFDWLVYLVGGFAISVAALCYLTVMLSRPPIHYLYNHLGPGLMRKARIR